MNTPDIDTAYAALHQEVDNFLLNAQALLRLGPRIHARIDMGRGQYRGAWLTTPIEQLEIMLAEEEADVIVYRLMLKIRKGKQ